MNQVNYMFEDAQIHINNIIALLVNRGLLDNASKDDFIQQFNTQKQSGLVQIKLKSLPPLKTLDTVSKQHYNIINKYCTNLKDHIANKVNYTSNNPMFLYVFPFINKTVNAQFKKIVENHSIDLLLAFADDQCIKSFKKILIKEESVLKYQKQSTTRRFDLIHFDAVLLNLLQNRHSSEYQIIPEQTLNDICTINHVNPLFLHKIFVNDPVILYYGFNPFTIIQETFLSDVTAGISSQFLLIVPVNAEQDIYNQFTYFL